MRCWIFLRNFDMSDHWAKYSKLQQRNNFQNEWRSFDKQPDNSRRFVMVTSFGWVLITSNERQRQRIKDTDRFVHTSNYECCVQIGLRQSECHEKPDYSMVVFIFCLKLKHEAKFQFWFKKMSCDHVFSVSFSVQAVLTKLKAELNIPITWI